MLKLWSANNVPSMRFKQSLPRLYMDAERSPEKEPLPARNVLKLSLRKIRVPHTIILTTLDLNYAVSASFVFLLLVFCFVLFFLMPTPSNPAHIMS